MKGYGGKILYVNLKTKETRTTDVTEKFAKKYLGGNGFGAALLKGKIDKKTDPLGPKNPLILAAGTFSGTLIPESSSMGVFAKSPQTGFIAEAYMRGHIAPELKYAGYDTIVFEEIAEKPVYLYVSSEKIEIRNAEKIWGKDSWNTELLLKKEMGNRIQVACIGPAGENKVSFSCITHNFGRNAGRTGVGAVMGSKKLKAVVIEGRGKIIVNNKKKLIKECVHLLDLSMTEKTEKYRVYGTAGGIVGLNEAGALPTRNWQNSQFAKVDKISGQSMRSNWTEESACFSCPIACGKITRFGKVIEEGPEYETIYALGSNCEISDIKMISKANELCDRYGIDTITTGNIIALAFELGERKLIKNPNLRFGNAKYVLKLIKQIAEGTGLGKDMQKGIVPFAKKYNGLDFAMQVKNMEPGGFHPNSLPAYALSIAVDVRGADHQRAGAYSVDLHAKGMKRFSIEGKAERVANKEDYYTLFDSLGLCKFARKFYPTEKMAELFTFVTGIKMTEKELYDAGSRIYTLEKLINIDCGWKEKDDSLPKRAMGYKLPDGPVKGQTISRKEFGIMKKEYYQSRGWDKKGIPTRNTLKKLRLT